MSWLWSQFECWVSWCHTQYQNVWFLIPLPFEMHQFVLYIDFFFLAKYRWNFILTIMSLTPIEDEYQNKLLWIFSNVCLLVFYKCYLRQAVDLALSCLWLLSRKAKKTIVSKLFIFCFKIYVSYQNAKINLYQFFTVHVH
jgi:hypothetical protein